MKPIILTIAAALLAGCASLASMSPEQLVATAKDKSASVTCGSYDTIPADVALMYVNIDERVPKNGKVEVKCGANSVTYTNMSEVQAP